MPIKSFCVDDVELIEVMNENKPSHMSMRAYVIKTLRDHFNMPAKQPIPNRSVTDVLKRLIITQLIKQPGSTLNELYLYFGEFYKKSTIWASINSLSRNGQLLVKGENIYAHGCLLEKEFFTDRKSEILK